MNGGRFPRRDVPARGDGPTAGRPVVCGETRGVAGANAPAAEAGPKAQGQARSQTELGMASPSPEFPEFRKPLRNQQPTEQEVKNEDLPLLLPIPPLPEEKGQPGGLAIVSALTLPTARRSRPAQSAGRLAGLL
jgi:hypothetical protein